MSVDMTEIVPPKWWLQTKRGWGMVITFVTAVLPVFGVWVSSLLGVDITPDLVSALDSVVLRWIEASGTVLGLALWVWGSFRPTAPLQVSKPAEKPVV